MVCVVLGMLGVRCRASDKLSRAALTCCVEAGDPSKSAGAERQKLSAMNARQQDIDMKKHTVSELRTERLNAAQLQRIASAAVAITEDELDDMCRPGSKFATAREAGAPSISLADQCANMMRVRATFPAVLAVPAPDF